MSTNPEPLRGVRVLIVEDEGLIAEELRDRLARLGLLIVDVVDTGEGAIRAAEQHRPDLILMDIHLKGAMDGIQAAQAIWASSPAALVFVTAHSDEETLRRAEQVEPILYVMKPFHERDVGVIEGAYHHFKRKISRTETK